MKNKKLLTLVIAVLYASAAYTQGPPPPPPPPGLPIDGGVIFLFVVGLVYGLKKVRD